MDVRDRLEVENKKNKDFLSITFNLLNGYSLSRKILIEKDKKIGKKQKHTDRKQTKLNPPHTR